MIAFPSTRVGLDPGTANTLVYVKGRGLAVNEPSLVTIRTSSGDIEAVGEQAEAGRGRTPRKFQTARPISSGIISDLRLFDGMLHRFLRKAHISGPLQRLKIAVAVPSGMTEVERLAVIESIRNADAADVWLVDQVLAAARGAGLAIEEPRGRMVVDIGAGVTDVAVISLGNTVCARATSVAGDDMDAAEEAPPDLSADLVEIGIVLTGGSALLRNLDYFISRDCGLPVKVAQDPLSCVIRGLAYQLNHFRRRDWRRFGDSSS